MQPSWESPSTSARERDECGVNIIVVDMHELFQGVKRSRRCIGNIVQAYTTISADITLCSERRAGYSACTGTRSLLVLETNR